MENLCIKLKNEGYTSEQIYQLMFLYSYNIFDYKKLIIEINPTISVEMLEQIIKCITHGTPYELFLNTNISVEKTIEIRRFLEDSLEKDYNKKNKYVILAKKMIENEWNPNVIYEFRRFFKCKLSFEYKQIEKLFNIVNSNQHWVIISCLYDITCETSNIKNAFDFLELEGTKMCLKKWKDVNEYALINLMIETKKYIVEMEK